MNVPFTSAPEGVTVPPDVVPVPVVPDQVVVPVPEVLHDPVVVPVPEVVPEPVVVPDPEVVPDPVDVVPDHVEVVPEPVVVPDPVVVHDPVPPLGTVQFVPALVIAAWIAPVIAIPEGLVTVLTDCVARTEDFIEFSFEVSFECVKVDWKVIFVMTPPEMVTFAWI